MIRGSKIPLAKQSEMVLKADIHNRFDVEIVDSITGEVKQKAVGHNVICNALWTALANRSTYFNYIHYGTGSGSPSSSDKSLFSFLGYVQVVSDQGLKIDNANCVASLTCKVQLAETVAVGSTLTEVGIATGTGSSTLVTHAMLKDMNGNNVSLEKTATDIVNIYATIFLHWSSEYLDVNSGIQLIGLQTSYKAHTTTSTYSFFHNFFGRSARGSYLYYMLTPNRFTHYGDSDETVEYISGALLNFDATTKRLTSTFRFGANYANLPGGAHGVMVYGSLSSNNMQSTRGAVAFLKADGDWFGGSEIVGESVGTGDGSTVDFATKFDLPYDATVYVNGEVVADAVVECVPVIYDRMLRYFNQILVKDGKIYPTAYYLADGNYSDVDRGVSWGIYENPFYQYGIKNIEVSNSNYGNSVPTQVSDDALNWSEPFDIKFYIPGTEIPEEYRYKRYWKFDGYGGTFCNSNVRVLSEKLTGKNIHFTSPPAEGSVITVSYKTPVIAKDSNHVFDVDLTIQLGEYTE